MLFLIRLVNMLFQIYFYLIIANVLLSWFPHNRSNAIFRFIHEMTEPFLNLFRRLLPFTRLSSIDFSPIVALLALELVYHLVLKLLYALAI
ncbi:hypothetical protein SDC9_183475 [bioreactor metagenome]|uniref:YggT family protein n=1 Tax=bioreactor metagenome TaxID=1076179 RepID=A0A645HB82_9ZZZZ